MVYYMKKAKENQQGNKPLSPAVRRWAELGVAAAAVLFFALACVLCATRARSAAPLQMSPADFAVEEYARINLNTADSELLQELPGIGETLAGRILDYRDSIGAFTSEEDVLAVYGIGEATWAKIEPYVTFGPADEGF